MIWMDGVDVNDVRGLLLLCWNDVNASLLPLSVKYRANNTCFVFSRWYIENHFNVIFQFSKLKNIIQLKYLKLVDSFFRVLFLVLLLRTIFLHKFITTTLGEKSPFRGCETLNSLKAARTLQVSKEQYCYRWERKCTLNTVQSARKWQIHLSYLKTHPIN